MTNEKFKELYFSMLERESKIIDDRQSRYQSPVSEDRLSQFKDMACAVDLSPDNVRVILMGKQVTALQYLKDRISMGQVIDPDYMMELVADIRNYEILGLALLMDANSSNADLLEQKELNQKKHRKELSTVAREVKRRPKKRR